MRELRWAIVAFRVALGVTFLSAVADRFGLWGPPGSPNASWGNWDRFVVYSNSLNWYLPSALQEPVAAIATAAELIFGLALVVGVRTHLAAYGAALLLTCFGLAMTAALGIKSPLNYSVWVDAAGAWLLAAVLKQSFLADGRRHARTIATTGT